MDVRGKKGVEEVRWTFEGRSRGRGRWTFEGRGRGRWTFEGGEKVEGRVEGRGEGNGETRATLYVFTSDSLRIHISSRFGV